MKRIFLLFSALILSCSMLTGCGYNELQSMDEAVNASWSEVLNQYQRRSDLIPNIVNTVRGETDFEKSTLTQVIEARAKATAVQATPDLVNDQAAMEKFSQAQGQLGNALSRLLVTVEQYPTLNSNKAFQDLRVELEGCENRIAIARNNFIKTTQEYNTFIRQFPQLIWVKILGYKAKAQFTVADEEAVTRAPTVDFGTATTPAPAPAPAPAPTPAPTPEPETK